MPGGIFANDLSAIRRDAGRKAIADAHNEQRDRREHQRAPRSPEPTRYAPKENRGRSAAPPRTNVWQR